MLAKDVDAKQVMVVIDLGRQALAGLSMEEIFLAANVRRLDRSPDR